MNRLKALSRYSKAVIASIPTVILIGNEVIRSVDAGTADGVVTRGDVLNILLVTFTAVGVYWKKNTPPPGEPEDPNISEAAA